MCLVLGTVDGAVLDLGLGVSGAVHVGQGGVVYKPCWPRQ